MTREVTQVRPVRTSEPLTLDETFDRIARDEIPGFAGQFLDDSGTPVVMLVDLRKRPLAEALVARQRGQAHGSAAAVQVRQARYDFTQLRQWQEALVDRMGADEIWGLDVDEIGNRVVASVESSAAVRRVRTDAVSLGIPRDAITVETRPRPKARTTLVDLQRPVQAAFQIVNSSGEVCSLGFNALMDGIRVFVTASHCSSQRNSLDSSVEYQPFTTDLIGWEYKDTDRHLCLTTAGTISCRWADASIFQYGASVAWDLGRIGRTLYAGSGGRGSLQIDPSSPSFQITQKLSGSALQVGSTVDKVGRTSGWTTGRVTASCVIISDGIKYACQYKTTTWSEPGDSGSPMFVTTAGAASVGLHGVLWGGPPTNFAETWYSTVSAIEKDFGVTLTVY